MSARECPICRSQHILQAGDSVYCEECSVYYTMNNGRPHPSALPIKETSQMALELCEGCRRGCHSRRIRCRTFQDYFQQLPYCRKCKATNKDFIKNLYYKNFIRYRNQSPVFGWLCLSVLFTSLCLWPDSIEVCVSVLLAVEYRRCRLSYVRAALILAVALQMGHLSFLRDALGLYSVYRMLFSKTIVFGIPGDLTSHDGLHSLLGRLNISGLRGGGPVPVVLNRG